MVARRVSTLALCTLLIAGTIDLGSPKEVHDASFEAAGRVLVSVTEWIPQRPGFEHGHPERLPVCPFCLLQILTAGAHLPSDGGLVATSRALAMALPEGRFESFTIARVAQISRAPPAVC